MEIQTKSNENKFKGMSKCLSLLHSAATTVVSDSLLDDCYREANSRGKEGRELFFSILFSIGDITSRQHNIFKKIKKDNGGNSNRESFYNIYWWMWNYHRKQFIKFLNAGLFNEYTCFDLIYRSRVKTYNRRVQTVYDSFSDVEYRKAILNFTYSVINGNNVFNKMLVAKFLSIPRLSPRKNHKRMREETLTVMRNKVKFLEKLSVLMGWEFTISASGKYANFKGYRAWRKQYNKSLESVLFSTKAILNQDIFDKEKFTVWLNQLPSSARFRVRNRLFYSKSNDYSHLRKWYEDWENEKANKQEEQRCLEEKIRQKQATEEDLIKLEKVKKEAKVNVGATSLKEIYEDIKSNKLDSLKVESFINKVNLPYNSLVIIDDSGSMQGERFNFASFIASVCLVKNPDDDARNLIGFFNTRSHWHSYINLKCNDTANSILRTTVARVASEPLVDPKLSFIDNYYRINNFCKAVYQSGCTYINSIPKGLHEKCKTNPEILDAIKSYPIWTIISDGEWNSMRTPEESIKDFMDKCLLYFGFKPYIIAIDINSYYANTNINKFAGIDNFMYINNNVAQIEQFLTNFKDMDVYDIYTPLQSIHRSNRYELIRENTL